MLSGISSLEIGMKIVSNVVCLLAVCLFFAGCGGDEKGGKEKKAAHNHDDHNHDHGDHIGAASAHKIELKDAPFNAKWEHAGDLVTIKICDNDYNKEMAIATDELVVTDAAGKNVFKLPAVEKNDKGEASEFELADEKLELMMDHKPTLSVKVGDKEYKTTIIHIH